MSMVAWWLMVCFGLMAAYQTVIGVWFCGLLLRRGAKLGAQVRWPKVAILMALRGADPQLRTSLNRIMTQDYPDFQLHVIVDSPTDSAYPVVQAACGDYPGRLDLAVLTERRTTCGLQCSAFVQAYQRVAQDAEVIVTIDGDLMPHATWLQELVAPLMDAKVGASFGNRWFTPQVSTIGALIRYLWNAAAIVPMAMLSIPWGGCFAMRRSAFDQADIADKWSRAIVHDAPIMECLKRLKLQIRFVPGLMMPIREKCSWQFCLDFIKRQMTWTRIYHSGWSAIVGHAVITTALWILALGLTLVGAWWSDWHTVALAGGSLAVYGMIMLILVSLLEYCVRVTLKRRGEPTQWITATTLLKLPLALVMAQATHFVAVILANNLRQVTWRGVTYLLHGPWNIQLKSDRPFEPTATDASL